MGPFLSTSFMTAWDTGNGPITGKQAGTRQRC